MLEELLAALVVFAAALLMLAVAGYFVARWLLIRLAERVSHQIATQIEAAAFTRTAGTSAAAVGERIRRSAVSRGIDVDRARALWLKKTERLATLMDAEVRLPLIGGVGLDAVLGLFPGAGDVISGLISLNIIRNAIQYGLPRDIIAKMVANMFVDLAFGAIPVIGDVFDIAFKANVRNVRILKDYLATQGARRDATSAKAAWRRDG